MIFEIKNGLMKLSIQINIYYIEIRNSNICYTHILKHENHFFAIKKKKKKNIERDTCKSKVFFLSLLLGKCNFLPYLRVVSSKKYAQRLFRKKKKKREDSWLNFLSNKHSSQKSSSSLSSVQCVSLYVTTMYIGSITSSSLLIKILLKFHLIL